MKQEQREEANWWLSRVNELIRTVEVLRDEARAPGTMGRRVIDDQLEGIRGEVYARLTTPEPRTSVWARLRSVVKA